MSFLSRMFYINPHFDELHDNVGIASPALSFIKLLVTCNLFAISMSKHMYRKYSCVNITYYMQ